MKKTQCFSILMLAAAASCGAAVPVEWDVEVARVQPAMFSAYRGETLELSARMLRGGRPFEAPLEGAALYWQTNGMGSAYWSAPASCASNVLSAVWSPTNDVGAATYNCFIGEPGGSYRAAFRLRLLDSPGASPNSLPLPAVRLDFANIEVANDPWTEAIESNRAGIASNSAALTALGSADAAEPVMPGWMRMTYPEEGQAVEPRAFLGDYYVFSFEGTPGSPRVVWKRGRYFLKSTYGNAEGIVDSWEEKVYFDMPDAPFGSLYEFALGLSPVATLGKVESTVEELGAAIESNRVNIASHSTAISTLSNTTSTVSSGLSQLAAEAAPAINGYARLYSFVTGATNANFVVTNYQLTAEAEAARTHFDPSDPGLDFSTVPPSLRMEDASSGTNRVVVDTRDWVVWYYAQKIGGAIAEAVSTAVDTCRAWVNFTASGLENPIPDTLVIDVPNIWLMAGKTFEKHVAGSNACWVIRSNGVTMPISDNAQSAGGFLELTDAFGTPYIRFNKTENYFVDPVADGIEYDKDIGEWRILYSTTNCPAGGANAAIVGSTTYPGKSVLKAEDDPDCPATITWTGSAKNWVMHAVPKPIDGAVPKSMFFGAVVEVQGQDYIEYLRPMSVPSLLVDSVKIAPDIPASHPVGTVVPWKVVQ